MIADLLTIKTPQEISAEAANPPAVLGEIPVYSDLFNHPELYQRIHVHLVAVRPKDPKDSVAGLHAVGLFGYKSLRHYASPSAKIEAYGANTGSTEYFPIGEHSFLPCDKAPLPVWDARSFVIAKQGHENTEGIKFTILDGKTELFEFQVPATDFPAMGEDWKKFMYSPEESVTVQGVEFVYQIRVTNCKDNISGKDVLAKCLVDTETVSYSEEVIEGEKKMDNALVQCWRQKKPSSKAVLWFIGRNDCFMHPHVGKTLFTDKGYDLYVLNYSCNGMCRKRGWVDDAHFNSHNRIGDFDLYNEQTEGAMGIMKSHKDYDNVIGYAHSTGAPVLINYLMEKGDDFFNGFIFNSPFLDWGADAVGGEMIEFAMEHTGVATALFSKYDNDFKLDAATTDKALEDTPVEYLGSEIVISAWAAKLWSQFYFDFRCRPIYKVPMTIGFAKGVTKVHNKLLKLQKEKKIVTLKPLVCITSRADDTLTASETLSRIDIVGPARHEIELNYNAHDVFLSEDEKDVSMAVEMVGVWMKSKGFA